MLRDWVRKAERSGRPIAIGPTVPDVTLANAEGFVPVPLPASPTDGTIRIVVRRKGCTVSIEWPASAAHECALLLRELVS
jgi:hypothetical protein